MFSAEDVRAIIQFSGNGYPLTSMYFRAPEIQTLARRKEQIAVKDLFREARERFNHNRYSPGVMESLERDAGRMIEFLNRLTEGVRHDYALFSCSARDFFRAVPVPRSPEMSVSVSERFCVRPLVAILDQYPAHCVALVNREIGRVYYLRMGAVEGQTMVADDVPRQVRESGWGGYQERRIERHVDEEVNRHYQHVVEELNNFYRRFHFDKLLIAGHKANADFEAMLPEELRRRVVGRFVIDPQLASEEDIRKRALEAVRTHAHDEKIRLVQQALDNAGPMGSAVLGLDPTLQALLKREVMTLLVGDGFCAGGKRCPNCGYLGGVMQNECPQCATGLQAVDDVVEEAIQQGLRNDAQVRFVNDDKAFQAAGNIGALLRFRSELRAVG